MNKMDQPPESLSIVITHHYTFENLGDYAIWKGMYESLKVCIPNATIYTISLTPEIDCKLESDVIFLESIPPRVFSAKDILYSFGFMISSTLWALLYRISKLDLSFIFPKKFRDSLAVYKNADVVLCKACDILSYDVYGLKVFIKAIYQMSLAIILNKKTVIYAQTILPISNTFDGRIAKVVLQQILKKVDLISVRDEISVNFLESLGLKVVLTADPAYLFNGTVPMNTKKNNNLRVGIITRYPAKPTAKTFGEYINTLRIVIEYLIKKHNAEIILLYQEKTISPMKTIPVDDVNVANEVILKLGQSYKKNVRFLNSYNLAEYFDLIRSCDIILSTRHIGVVFAIKNGIPVIGLDYTQGKIRSQMKLAGIEKYCIDTSKINPEDLIQMIENMLERREEISQRIISHSEKLIDSAFSNAILVKELLIGKI